MKQAPVKDSESVDKALISARITQLEQETRIEAAQIEQATTRLAMKRGALLELRQLVATKAPDKSPNKGKR